MAVNKAYLTCDKTPSGDEVYTPFYAVEPLLEFIPKSKTIWCPFDKEWSAFVQLFTKNGNKVIYSHIDDSRGGDFFYYEPKEHYDIIISNPPYSKKDKVLKKCYELNKPFCLLMPINALQGKARVDLFLKYGLELIVFDLRIDYHTNRNFKKTTKGNHFGSAYFCHNVLKEKIIFKKITKYEKNLK